MRHKLANITEIDENDFLGNKRLEKMLIHDNQITINIDNQLVAKLEEEKLRIYTKKRNRVFFCLFLFLNISLMIDNTYIKYTNVVLCTSEISLTTTNK